MLKYTDMQPAPGEAALSIGQTDRIPDEVIKRLLSASNVAVLTGAGVSAESGVPTFRGEDGLWKNYRAEELATPGAFQQDPDLVWEWYHWRRGIVSQASPNAAHQALVRIEEMAPAFLLITQNVDGLHLEAGSKEVLEIHGNLRRARCSDCGDTVQLTDEEGLIDCGECGSDMRPDVVWFGENLDPVILERSFAAATNADFFLVAGTSSVVQPAASLAWTAGQNNGFVLEVNLDPTPLTGQADATLLGKAGDILSKLVEDVWGSEQL